KVPALFPQMEAGRLAGLAFDDKRSSRWGSLVRQKWMTHRTKVLSAVKRAVKADAEAKALKNEEPAKEPAKKK
ncbi:MAG: hypothetical protein P1V36_06795, partial [Planctomycetota bacterium]|nr:hypothetical protein [Planctomycetota bacterium]